MEICPMTGKQIYNKPLNEHPVFKRRMSVSPQSLINQQIRHYNDVYAFENSKRLFKRMKPGQQQKRSPSLNSKNVMPTVSWYKTVKQMRTHHEKMHKTHQAAQVLRVVPKEFDDFGNKLD